MASKKSFAYWSEHIFTIDSRSLSIFRIIYSFYAIGQMPSRAISLHTIPAEQFKPPPGIPSLFSSFPSHNLALTLNIALVCALFSLATGFKTRFTSLCVVTIAIILNAWHYSTGKINHDFLFVIAPLFLAFSNWGQHYSVDALLQRRKPISDNKNSARCLALYALTCGLAFSTAGIAKAYTGWLSLDQPAALGHLASVYFEEGRQTELARLFMANGAQWFWELQDWFTVLFEIGFLIAVINRFTFQATLALAVTFHLGVYLLMDIGFTQNLIVYSAFIPWTVLWPALCKNTQKATSLKHIVVLLVLASISSITAIYVLLVYESRVISLLDPIAPIIVFSLGLSFALGWMAFAALTIISGFRDLSAASVNNQPSDAPIIYFDGYCGLCNTWVDRVLQHDHAKNFRFAPLQGETAKSIFDGAAGPTNPDTVLLQDESGVHQRSTAVLRVMSKLPRWSLIAKLALLIPVPLRDAGYAAVAKHRMRFGGGPKATCRMPTPEEAGIILP